MSFRQELRLWYVYINLPSLGALDKPYSTQTLGGHASPITALDFSEPYGTLVSASGDDSSPLVHDLLTGGELGRLRGHNGPVKTLQVEDHVCLTGGADGAVRLWDLRRVGDDDDGWELEGVPEEVDEFGITGEFGENTSVRGGKEREREGPCVRVLEGHSKAVTTLYFEDDCLVRPAHAHSPYHFLTSSSWRRLRAHRTRLCVNGISPPANA
jgi:WD40 repeat protein